MATDLQRFAGVSLTVQRGEVLKETAGFCDTCHQQVPATYEALRNDRAVFLRHCPTHGTMETDLGYQAPWYRTAFAIDRLLIERYGSEEGSDISKGLSPYKLRRKAGLAILEVTERCNLTCPMCYAYSSPAGRDYTLEEIEKRMDALIEVEGKGISLQISGGEPSIRKDLDKIAALVKAKGFAQLEIVSNGIRIAKEPEFAHNLRKWGFTSVYLQFDSRRAEDIEFLRGEDLLHIRDKAMANLESADIPVVLAVPLYDGLNDDQVGTIIDYAWHHQVICAINFQAATPFGRFDVDPNAPDNSPGKRHLMGRSGGEPRKLRMPDIIDLIAKQAGMPRNLFFPVGAGSPLCNAFTLLIATEKDGYKPVAPNFTLEDYLSILGKDPVLTMRMLTRGRAALLPYLLQDWKGAKSLIKTLWPHVGADPSFFLKHKMMTVYVKPFMDTSDFDLERVERCCFHNSSPRGVMSFCALNAGVRAANPTPESAFVPLPTRKGKQQLQA